jgi:hypothetical protein
VLDAKIGEEALLLLEGGLNSPVGLRSLNLFARTGLVNGVDVMTRAQDYTALYREVGPQLWRAIYVYSGGREARLAGLAPVLARPGDRNRTTDHRRLP